MPPSLILRAPVPAVTHACGHPWVHTALGLLAGKPAPHLLYSFAFSAQGWEGPGASFLQGLKAQKKSGSSQQACSTQVPAPHWPLAQGHTLGRAPESVCLGRTWWLERNTWKVRRLEISRVYVHALRRLP